MSKRMKFVIAMFGVAAWAFFFLLLYADKANAMTIRGDHNSCYSLALASEKAVYYRDSGQPFEPENKATLLEALEAAKGNPNSFIKDDDDVKLVVELFGNIWKTDDDVATSVNNVYLGCMAKAV